MTRPGVAGSVTVGDYTIEKHTDGKLWIIFQGGEATTVVPAQFEKLIADFYSEVF